MSSLDHPCTLRLLGWVRTPLQMLTELAVGDLAQFYKDKIEGLAYSKLNALRLLKVGFHQTSFSRYHTFPYTHDATLCPVV